MINGLPLGWRREAVNDIAEVFLGKTPAKKDYLSNGRFKVVKFRDLQDGQVNFYNIKDGFVRDDSDLNLRELHCGDVLITSAAHSGENIGKKCAYVTNLPKEFDRIFFTGELLNIRCSDEILSKWIYLFFRSAEGYSEIQKAVKGVHLTSGRAKQMRIPLASSSEQKIIIIKLEKLLMKIDDSQRRLARIPTLLKRFRQSVLTAACSGRLTSDWRLKNSLNYDWSIKKLSELGNVTGGITKNAKRNTIKLQVPYLRVANVYENKLELDEVYKIGVTDQELDRALLLKDDILFVEGNGSLDQIGRVAIWDGSITQCVHQNHLIKFRANGQVLPRYVLLQMMSPEGRSQLVEKSTSSAGLNTLSISKISDVNVPVPILEEQREIVRRVSDFFNMANKIETRYKKGQVHVDKLMQAILAKAFHGKLNNIY